MVDYSAAFDDLMSLEELGDEWMKLMEFFFRRVRAREYSIETCGRIRISPGIMSGFFVNKISSGIVAL